MVYFVWILMFISSTIYNLCSAHSFNGSRHSWSLGIKDSAKYAVIVIDHYPINLQLLIYQFNPKQSLIPSPWFDRSSGPRTKTGPKPVGTKTRPLRTFVLSDRSPPSTFEYFVWSVVWFRPWGGRSVTDRPSCPPSTPVRLWQITIFCPPNPSTRWTVHLFDRPTPSISDDSWDGRSELKFWSVVYMDGWTVRRRPSSSVEAWCDPEILFIFFITYCLIFDGQQWWLNTLLPICFWNRHLIPNRIMSE